VDGTPLLDIDEFSRKVAEVEIDLTAVEFTELRTLAAESRGKPPGPESSILKIKGTEIQQRITELTLEAVGYYANPDPRAFGENEYPVGPENAVGAAGVYFNMRKASIYGGSNEIQRNIIAKAVLGL
jgi:alkylation response protein AidB-like acyl-CoA dehydrogenase